MYGPPQDCKRKPGMDNIVCTNVFGLSETPDHDGFRRPLPYWLDGLEGPLPLSGLESAGSTVVPSP
jgi:hypothetical protein